MAWLDDDGDGFYTADDGLIAQKRGFAYAGSFASNGEPPYISWVNAPATIENRRGQIEATVRLEDSNHDGIYKGTFAGFDQTGPYRIVVYAVDEDDQQSRPRATTVQTGWELHLPLLLR